jgi:hypothetical protein
MDNIIIERNKEVANILSKNKRFINIVLRSVRNFSGLEQDDKKSILYELLLKHTEQWLKKNKPCKLTTYLYLRLVRDLKYTLNKEQLLINTCSNVDEIELSLEDTTQLKDVDYIKKLVLELIDSEYVPHKDEKELLKMNFVEGYTPKEIEQRTEFTTREFDYIRKQFINSVKRSIKNRNFKPKKTPNVILRKVG